MKDKIGTAAGEVWRFLEKNGPSTATLLKKEIDLPGSSVERAIGWLAREDKIKEIQEGKTNKFEAIL